MPPHVGLSTEQFGRLFPFHLELDGELAIRGLGPSLARACPEITLGAPWLEHLALERPQVSPLGIEALRARGDEPFVLAHRTRALRLRGQMLFEPQSAHARFVGLPWVTDIDQLREHGIRISDFPAHSPQADLLFVIQNLGTSLEESRDLAVRLRQNQQVLARAKEQAERAIATKDAFLANMSHELRTPLNGILGVARLLADSQLDAEQGEYSRLIECSGRALLTILDDVLEFSRVQSGRIELSSAPFDPEALARQVIELFQGNARAKGIGILLKLPHDVPSAVMGDVARTRQILTNLLSNAVKFTHGGEITLDLSVERDEDFEATLRIAVHDTGVGIPADARERIFEDFAQVDESAARHFGGAGLGLAFCKRIVALMAGSIAVESEVGRGSTFTLSIPTRITGTARSSSMGDPSNARESSVAWKPPPARLPAAAGARLLIVEDNAVNRLVAERLLRKLGYEVHLACDGAEAVAAFQRERPDLILMDMQMPGMDGLEATRRIRALGPAGQGVPIIALTANALPENRDTCMAAGMDDFVTKPFEFHSLAHMLVAWLQSKGRSSA